MCVCINCSCFIAYHVFNGTGYEVTVLEDVVARAHLFVTATGCEGIIRPEHLLEMREDAIVCNIGHFDCEINTAWLKDNCERVEIKPQVSRYYYFPVKYYYFPVTYCPPVLLLCYHIHVLFV